LRIVNATRFDDVDHDLGYEYRGYNYVVQNEDEEFLVRTYDDEPCEATVLRPTTMSANIKLRKLVDFLQTELGASRISLYKGELGRYAEIDLDSLAFCTV
jgi:hypothetical protein